MSENVTLALIAAVQAVMVAALGAGVFALRKVSKDTVATRAQVVNHHPESPNLREENDGRHAETIRMFQEVRKDIGGIRSDLRAFGGRLTTLEELEITHPRKKGTS